MAFFTADKIGTTVVLMPTDNAVSRVKGAGSAFDQTVEGTITGIGRVNLSVSKNGSGVQEKFEFDEEPYPRLSNNANCGYRVFADWQEFYDYRIGAEVKSRLIDVLRGYGSEYPVTDGQYKKIAEILGWEDLLIHTKHVSESAE